MGWSKNAVLITKHGDLTNQTGYMTRDSGLQIGRIPQFLKIDGSFEPKVDANCWTSLK